MKTTVGTLVLLGTVLSAGWALAQSPAQPRGGQARTEPTAGAGETRAQVNSSGGTLAMETISPRTGPVPVPGCGPVAPTPTSPSTRSTTAPVNGIGGTGGGRLSNRDHIDQDAQVEARVLRVINNSETDAAQVEGTAARPGTATGSGAPATPACIPPPTGRR
tara:strand:+ start:528 stop:1013 length:486 start_codon:yes stop_codon:yes gene_type:complete